MTSKKDKIRREIALLKTMRKRLRKLIELREKEIDEIQWAMPLEERIVTTVKDIVSNAMGIDYHLSCNQIAIILEALQEEVTIESYYGRDDKQR